MKYHDLFRVAPGTEVSLATIDPGFKDKHEDKASAAVETEAHAQRLGELQYRLGRKACTRS